MILHGRKIVIKKGDGTAIAACKSCDIDSSCDTIETASRTSSEFREFIKSLRKSTADTEQKFLLPLMITSSQNAPQL